MEMNLYGNSKTSEMVTVIYSIKNIHFLAPRFLVFFACRVTSKDLGIGAAECSWGEAKTIKSGENICYQKWCIIEKEYCLYICLY